MKRILTSDDVLALVRRGETELVMGPEDRLTDLALSLIHISSPAPRRSWWKCCNAEEVKKNAFLGIY